MPYLVGLSADAAVNVAVVASPWRIGRGAECELHLASASISRVHAELVERDGTWSIRNRSQTNPTRLNGAIVIGERPLAEGARLDLGEISFRFQAVPPVEEDLPSTVGYGDGPREPLLTKPTVSGRVTGGQDGALDVVGMFHSGRRTGRLVLADAMGGELSLWYADGEVTGARSGTLVGKPAFLQLALKAYQSFRFFEGEAWDGQRLVGGSQGMLMEIARVIDHARRRSTSLPG